MLFKKTAAITALLLTVTVCLRADEPTERLLAEVQQKYQSLQAICADFTQTFQWKLTGETQTVRGKICALDGNQFKIETSDQLIVTNGKVLWTLNKANNQVVIDRPENAADDNPFLKNFLDKYLVGYAAKPATSDRPGLTCVIMTSKTGEHFVPQIKLWIDDAKIIRRVEQTDLNDNVTVFQLDHINTPASLTAKDFIFTAPQGADIIDMR